jgi:hypothetical protein
MCRCCLQSSRDRDLDGFDRRCVKALFEVLRRREGVAGDVAGAEREGEAGFVEGVRGDAEAAFAEGLDLDLGEVAIGDAEGVEQGCGAMEVDAA